MRNISSVVWCGLVWSGLVWAGLVWSGLGSERPWEALGSSGRLWVALGSPGSSGKLWEVLGGSGGKSGRAWEAHVPGGAPESPGDSQRGAPGKLTKMSTLKEEFSIKSVIENQGWISQKFRAWRPGDPD